MQDCGYMVMNFGGCWGCLYTKDDPS